MRLRPLPGCLLVRPDVPRTETASGLALVQDWNPATTGTVVAVGSGVLCRCGRRHVPPVGVGDHVVFSYTRGQTLILDGLEMLSLRHDDMLATLEDEDSCLTNPEPCSKS